MSNALRAALLSGLLFPGIGQMALKRRGRGFTILGLTAFFLVYVVVAATQRAMQILDQIDLTSTTLDISEITRMAHEATYSGSDYTTIGLVFIVFCWVFSIIDAYLIGRQIDEAARTRKESHEI